MNTTAKMFSKFYAELLEEGVPETIAGEILLTAAREHLPRGFSVKADEVAA